MTKLRISLLALLFVAGYGVLIFRAFNLQILPQRRVEDLARRQLHHKVDIVGRRGSIRDRYGRELAVSTNSVSVFANPRLVKNPGKVSRVLAPILTVPEGVLLAKFQAKNQGGSEKRFVWLGRQLKPDQMEALSKVDLKSLEGVGVLPEYRREFPQGTVAAHVLGFVDVDGAGLAGIERRFDSDLLGPKSTVSLDRDNLGRPIFSQREQIRLDLNSGAEIQLTLDANLQYFAERALKEGVEAHQADGGTAIVMNPANGDILALANDPSFDPNSFQLASAEARKNLAVTDPIEPGSVLKPFVVARALEDKIVRPDTMISAGNGFIKIGKKTIGEADAKHRFSELSVVDLIRISSNVATVMLKNKMGWPRIEDTYRKLGFGSLTGVEVPGESKGIFYSPRPDQALEQATMSFGQGIALTPLQIISAYATIANGGLRIKPHLILSEAKTDVLPTRVFSEATTQKMRAILERVVEGEGTGVKARVEGFKVAGKTGTAQMINFEHGGYQKGAYWSSFAGFVPSENPRYVIYVVINRPKKNGYYGGVVAAPVFSKIAQAALRSATNQKVMPVSIKELTQKELPKNIEVADSGDFSARKPLRAVDKSSEKATSKSAETRIPDITGTPLTYALSVLKNQGFKVELEGEGDTVHAQMPLGGSRSRPESMVYLRLRDTHAL